MAKGQFDVEAFYAALDSQRQSKRLNWNKSPKNLVLVRRP